MNDLEDQIRKVLSDPSWALPVPPDPAGWAKQRARRGRWRPAAAALAAAAVTAVAAVAVPAALQPAGTAPGLVATQSRDGLTLRVELDGDRAVVGEQLRGELTVRNSRDEPVRLLEACRAPLRLFADYRGVLQDDRSLTGPAGQYRRLALGLAVDTEPRGPFALTVRQQTVVREERDCSDGGKDQSVELMPGRTERVRVDWTPVSHGGAAVDGDLAMLANVTYLLADGPDGPLVGDPGSRGSTTPQARVLAVDFSLPLTGGDPDRATLPEVVDAALADPAFRGIVDTVPTGEWFYVWALPFDKPARDPDGSFTAGEADTDQVLKPAETWYVVLRYRTTNGTGGTRTTALVDGVTGQVRDVQTRADDRR